MIKVIVLIGVIFCVLAACKNEVQNRIKQLGESYGYDEISDIDELADNLMDDKQCRELRKLGYHEMASRCEEEKD